MMTFLEFTFKSVWHFFGVFVLLLAALAFIENIVNAFTYRITKIKELKTLDKSIQETKQEIKTLKATIQKDREKIADYLNELTKNSNEQSI